MPLISTRGAASAQGFGEFAQSAAPVYIEDVFSTYLYTGNGSTQTITNGIDLSGEGGLVWSKKRTFSGDAGNDIHSIVDTNRGYSKYIYTNLTNAEATDTNRITGFNANGYSLGSDSSLTVNQNTQSFVSWTFRKQAKFFDVVTWTGTNGTRAIPHNLASTPGFFVVKKTSNTSEWYCWHNSFAANKAIALNGAGAAISPVSMWGNTLPNSTTFTVGQDWNDLGRTYVAYLFAHNAGGFGLSGTDNVISCGSYTNDGSGNATVNLGWEPQFVILKNASGTSSWLMYDNMRGMPVETGDRMLAANKADAEITLDVINPTATGFDIINSTPSATYIYIAIRRGPMKVPESGTEVYTSIARTGTGAVVNVTGVGFAPDAAIVGGRNIGSGHVFFDKLRGPRIYLQSQNTSAQSTNTNSLTSFNMDGVTLGADTAGDVNLSGGYNYINHFFKRAPGFFDIVCYTGTSAVRTVSHNLGAAPELMLIKQRNGSTGGIVYAAPLGTDKAVLLFNDQASAAIAAFTNGSVWSNTAPTASVFTLGTSSNANTTTYTYVAYLFASCPGVSKVGSYTGTGTTKQIDCGFTGGARFVLIKRTDSTGDWYVYDSARGIVAGNDPYLFLNSTAAEVTNTDYVDTYSAGFELSSTAPAGLNANGGSFIFFAVA